MRLIDADALNKTISEEFHGISATGFIYFMRDKTPIEVYNRVRDLIDNTPTVELDESIIQDVLNKRCMTVVTNEHLMNLYNKRPQEGELGKWIITAIQCPNCLAYFHRTDGYSMKKLKECPNCGANMIKEAE